MAGNPACIDISHWQGFPDFDAVAASGVVACIMKATEGTSYVDPNRAINFENATKAGIACCCYFWLKPGNAAAQTKFFLETIQPIQGERVVIDYEEDGCTLDDLYVAVQTLMDYGSDLQITVYSGHLLKEQLNGNHDPFLAENTDLWLAQYTDGSPSWSTGTYPHWALWQYSESGVVDGIDDTYVDLNEFNGTDGDLVAWISPQGTPEPVPPEPTEDVQIDIFAPPSVTVKVSLNGTKVPLKKQRLRVKIPRGPDLHT